MEYGYEVVTYSTCRSSFDSPKQETIGRRSVTLDLMRGEIGVHFVVCLGAKFENPEADALPNCYHL